MVVSRTHLDNVDLLQLQQSQTPIHTLACLGRTIVNLLRYLLLVSSDFRSNVIGFTRNTLKGSTQDLLRFSLAIPWGSVNVIDATLDRFLDGANGCWFVKLSVLLKQKLPIFDLSLIYTTYP